MGLYEEAQVFRAWLASPECQKGIITGISEGDDDA